MRLKCTGLPHRHSNCLVAVLGAGKAVKFHKDAVVDLSDPQWRLDEPQKVGYQLLSRYPSYLEEYKTATPLAKVAPENKAMKAAPKFK